MRRFKDGEKEFHHSYVMGSRGQHKTFEISWTNCDSEFDKGDIVDIQLDLKKKKVSWLINDIQAKPIFDVKIGDEIEYRLFVVMFAKNGSATLMDFFQSW